MNEVLCEACEKNGCLIRVVLGDLTSEEADAVVNAANEYLAHGGGVAGALVRRGGYAIQEESSAWVSRHGPLPTGSAMITSAGRLPARWVIHAVGPIWGSGDEERKLTRAVQSAMRVAEENDLACLSMPAISSGIYGFPKDLCARVMLTATREYLAEHPQGSLREIRFCLIDSLTANLFRAEAERQCVGAHSKNGSCA